MSTTGKEDDGCRSKGRQGAKLKITDEGFLTIGPKQLWVGILFHLQQDRQPLWKHVETVTLDSIFYLYKRLMRQRPEVTVPKFVWRRMNDTERLTFLLEVTKTTMRFIKGTMVVELTSEKEMERRAKLRRKK